MEEFIEQLLKDKGVPEGVDPEVRKQLAADLVSRATDFVNRRMIDSLSDEQLAEFEKILDEQPNDTSALQNFIEKNVADKESITAAALLEFRALYLGKAA